MFCVYFKIEMFLLFAIIAFAKIDRVQIFVTIIFFQTFDITKTRKKSQIFQNERRACRKIFDI